MHMHTDTQQTNPANNEVACYATYKCKLVMAGVGMSTPYPPGRELRPCTPQATLPLAC